LKEKNVVNTFKVAADSDSSKAYDVDAVLKFLGESPAPAAVVKNKK
jgi:hypothetical protein